MTPYKTARIQADTPAMTRKMLAQGGDLMMVEVKFHHKSDDPGFHTHPHEQIAYVLRGSFEFINNGESTLMQAGDSVYVEPDVVHGCKPLEDDSVLLDIFTPQREDFN